MSEKKYDVYVGNDKVGEVWGESTRDIEIREELRIRDMERNILRSMDQYSDSPDAVYRNNLRKEVKNNEKITSRIKWLFIVGVISSALLFLSNLNLLVEFPLIILYSLISIYTLIYIALSVAFFVLNKDNYCNREIIKLGKISLTGNKIRKLIPVIFGVLLYLQFNILCIVFITVIILIYYIISLNELKKNRNILDNAIDKAIKEKNI